MKKLIKLVSILCIISLLASCGLVSKVEKKEESKKNSEVIVTVGDKDYTMERFNLYFYTAQGDLLVNAGYQQSADVPEDFWTQEVDGSTMLEVAKENALTSLINDALAYQKAVEYGLELTKDEINNIDNQMTSLSQDEESLKQFDAIGVSVDELKEYYNEGFLIQHLLPELISKGEIKIDDAEVMDTFRDTYVKAKHILISTVDANTGAALSEEEVALAQTKAQDILNQLNAGADFDELMNANSEDPGLANAPDGYVFTKGEMVQEFETAAYALAENQISGLVNTSYGIHILKRVPFDMTGSQEISCIESIESQLAMPEFETLLKTWKSKTDIKTHDKVLDKVKAFDAKQFFGA